MRLTYKEFKAICREEIAKQAEACRRLRIEAQAYPRVDRSTIKQHAHEYQVLSRRIRDGASKGEEVDDLIDTLETLQEQGRQLRLVNNIENGRARAALNAKKVAGPRPAARGWHQVHTFARLRPREFCETTNAACYHDDKYLAWRAALSRAYGDAKFDIDSKLSIAYKYGDVVFDFDAFREWVDNPSRLPKVLQDYIDTCRAERERASVKVHAEETPAQTVSVQAA